MQPFWMRAVAVGRFLPDAKLYDMEDDDELRSIMLYEKAEVVFKGDEYALEDVVHLAGMDVELVPMLTGHSTTLQVQHGLYSRV